MANSMTSNHLKCDSFDLSRALTFFEDENETTENDVQNVGIVLAIE